MYSIELTLPPDDNEEKTVLKLVKDEEYSIRCGNEEFHFCSLHQMKAVGELLLKAVAFADQENFK